MKEKSEKSNGTRRPDKPSSLASSGSCSAQNKTPRTHTSRGTLSRTALPRKLLDHNLTSGDAGVNGPIVREV